MAVDLSVASRGEQPSPSAPLRSRRGVDKLAEAAIVTTKVTSMALMSADRPGNPVIHSRDRACVCEPSCQSPRVPKLGLDLVDGPALFVSVHSSWQLLTEPPQLHRNRAADCMRGGLRIEFERLRSRIEVTRWLRKGLQLTIESAGCRPRRLHRRKSGDSWTRWRRRGTARTSPGQSAPILPWRRRDARARDAKVRDSERHLPRDAARRGCRTSRNSCPSACGTRSRYRSVRRWWPCGQRGRRPSTAGRPAPTQASP